MCSELKAGRRAATGRFFWTVLAAVVILGLFVRLQPWTHVFAPDVPGAVFVGDTDTYYHALRAQRIAAHFPAITWTDPGMNYPDGADILWPPLFDATVAALARLAPGESPPSRETVERVAALLPPVLGAATVGCVAALAFLLFADATALWAGLFLATLPVHVEFSTLGRPDQHVSESLLQTLVVMAFVAAWRASRTRLWLARLALGLAIALSFWNWQGSALYLILLCAFVAIWYAWRGERAEEACRVLASGCAIGTALLATSIVAWGRNGALFASSLSGVNGVQVAVTALAALFGGVLALAGRRFCGEVAAGSGIGAARRLVPPVVAALACSVAAAAMVRVLGDGVHQGIAALVAGNAWYASIREFQPPLFGGSGIRRELASWLPRFAPMFAMPFAAIGLAARWRRCPQDRAALGFVAVWGGLLLVATLVRLRFALYLSVPAVLWTAVAVGELGRTATRLPVPLLRTAAAALLLIPAGFYFSHGGLWPDPEQREVALALEWLRFRPSFVGDRPSVFSEWDWGHLVQYFGQRPAVATPFGTDGGPGALDDTAHFFLSTSPDDAERILDRRRAGYLLLVDPVAHAAAFERYVPAGREPPVRIEWDRVEGPHLVARPEVDDLVAVRVYYDNGLSSRGLPTLPRYRLVYEGRPDVGRQVRLFEIVRGAELAISGGTPGGTVRAQVQLRTNRGREVPWFVQARAHASGRTTLTVPFATGDNGAVVAGPYHVSCGIATGVDVIVSEDAVNAGARIPVACTGYQ